MVIELGSAVKFQGRTYFSHFFYLFIVPIYEDKDSFICNGDIQIPNATRSKSQRVCFFVFGMEELFASRIQRQADQGGTYWVFSKVTSWRARHDQCGEILCNFGIFEIVAFVVTPTNFGVASIGE